MSDDFTITLGWIADVVDGDCLGDRDLVIANFETDTRNVFSANSLFFALPGKNFDGESFVDRAFELGASSVVTTQTRNGAHVKVDDVSAALRRLATAYRNRLSRVKWLVVIGSNGKTVVKDMVADVLSRTYRTYRSPGSYNSQIGVPLSVLEAKPYHQFAVLEAGVSEAGEMSVLRDIVQPDAVVWTNVGDAHSEGLGGRAGIVTEKSEMLRDLTGPFFFSSNIRELRKLAVSNPQPVEVSNVSVDSDFVEFSVGETSDFSVRAVGAHNGYNGGLAVAVGTFFGVPQSEIRGALRGFRTSDLRLQIHTTSRGVTIINDTYNADPTSARAAIGALDQYAMGHRRIVVFGDMKDLGSEGEVLHREVGELIAQSGVDGLVTIGEFAKATLQGAQTVERRAHFATVADAASTIREWVEPGDYLLVKGSRAMRLERVAELFTDSVAPARLFVDLDLIARNIDAIRERVGPDVALMPVVKSFAYGNDSTRVAQLLSQRGVHAFVVAYPDEAIPLRERGIDKPILVTNVFPEELDKIARYGLTAVVPREGFVDALQDFGESIDVHLEIDTGMSRTGVPPERALACARRLHRLEHVNLRGVMTHLSSSDDADQDAFTAEQLGTFSSCLHDIESAGIDTGLVHAANTAAAWRLPESRFDAVRIGIGIYGVPPSPDVSFSESVEFALRFVTKVIDVRTIRAGQSVSYGRRWTATRDSEIATIAIGYNDGFPRFMSNGGEVLIRGRRCRVVGSVCMDATMVDVTECGVSAGDEVVLFGTQDGETISVDEIAVRGDTISYEILTRVSPRVRRIFSRR